MSEYIVERADDGGWLEAGSDSGLTISDIIRLCAAYGVAAGPVLADIRGSRGRLWSSMVPVGSDVAAHGKSVDVGGACSITADDLVDDSTRRRHPNANPPWMSAMANGLTPVSHSPFAVLADYSDETEAIGSEAVRWLVDHKVSSFDVGRFFRFRNWSKGELLAAMSGLTENDRQSALLGYVSEPEAPRTMLVSPTLEGFARVDIDAEFTDIRPVARRAWQAIREANEPAQVFSFGDGIGWVVGNDGNPARIETLTETKFIHLQHRVIRWFRINKNGEREVRPPTAVVKDMMATPHPPLPRLVTIATSPIFSPKGALVIGPGYDPSSEVFVWSGRLEVPFVPRYPTEADVSRALHWLQVELLGDFPFEDDASRTNALAAMLLPFCRPMINGPTPLHLIDKPDPGTGGSLLANAISLPALGRAPDVFTEAKLEDDWRFRILSVLLGGPSVVLLDNVRRPLDNSSLAAALTADVYTDRVIRSSTMGRAPVRCLWLATGNNVQLSHELARRSVLIRLDANVERPESRAGFRHARLLEWAADHRAELVWSALVIVNNWLADGRAVGSKIKGSYESWAETIGGILQAAGVHGFLSNTGKLMAAGDAEREMWEAFVEAWWDTHANHPVTASLLYPLAEQHLDLDTQGSGRSRDTSWGMMLAGKRDTIIAGKKITSAREKNHAKQWRLTEITGKVD